MLPPHRPFRDKPTAEVVIKKKSKPAAPSISDRSPVSSKHSLKPALVVLTRRAEEPANTGA